MNSKRNVSFLFLLFLIKRNYLNKVEAAVVGHERGDLLAVLDELHTNALANGRVRLFCFNATGKNICKENYLYEFEFEMLENKLFLFFREYSSEKLEKPLLVIP